MQSLSDIIAGPQEGRRTVQETRRTHQPVRRLSRAKGRCEGVFWRSTNRQEVRQVVVAARRYELTTRQAGQRNGALGPVALEILELFANLVDFRTGRLEPSLDFMMAKLRRSRDAITRALRALRDHGFLDWLRRFVPTGNEGRGPQVQQTSNAYRMSLPARALRLMGQLFTPAPAPDDFSHAQQQAATTYRGQVDSLSLPDRARHVIDADNPLAEALARLGSLIQERESAKRSESQAD
jgi:hypothetical protein